MRFMGKLNDNFEAGLAQDRQNEDSSDTDEELNRRLRFRKICAFWDNASIHAGPYLKELLQDVLEIQSVKNLAYRPDLVGLELQWGIWKGRYRKTLCEMVTLRQEINNREVVKAIIEATDPEEIKKCARAGMRALLAAKPIVDDYLDKDNGLSHVPISDEFLD